MHFSPINRACAPPSILGKVALHRSLRGLRCPAGPDLVADA
ncbi:hypothetical protein C4K25_5589 [Pseudomonas chlororaphis]|nr:hypothetical protein C4K25_5589 [Pseudomonas chlororaphis]